MMLNPVLRREAKTSLRSWKTFIAITLYVAMISAISILFIFSSMSYNSGFDPQDVIELFIILGSAQFVMIMLITPALAGGSISGERERQTLDLLLITKMSPISIILGKLFSSLGIVILMIISTLPIFGVIFYFGGISILSLLGLFAFLIIIACMVGAISIFFSTLFKKTVTSIVFVYLTLGFMGLGTLFADLLFNAIYWSVFEEYPPLLISLILIIINPGIGFISLIDKIIGSSIMSSRIVNSFSNIVGAKEAFIVKNFWCINIIMCVIIAAIFVFLASLCINVRKKK